MTDLRERLRLDSRDGDSPISRGGVFEGARPALEFSIVENMESFSDAVAAEEWPSAISHLQGAAVAGLKLASWIISQAPAATGAVSAPPESGVKYTMADAKAFLAEVRACVGDAMTDEAKSHAPTSRDPEEAE